MNWSFDYIKKYGISTLASYPYLEEEEKCKGHLNNSNIVLVSYSNVSPLENFLKEAVGEFFYLYKQIQKFENIKWKSSKSW